MFEAQSSISRVSSLSRLVQDHAAESMEQQLTDEEVAGQETLHIQESAGQRGKLIFFLNSQLINFFTTN